MTLGKKRVGIVLPAVRCVCDQVRRISPQMRRDDRLIIVWNGPATGHSCADSHKDERVRWTEIKAYSGAGNARNQGARMVNKCDIIAFVDDDDLVTGEWLRQLVEPLENATADLSAGTLLVRGIKKGGSLVLPGRDFWHAQSVFGGNFAISRAAWSTLHGFDTTFLYCEDTDLAWRAILKGFQIAIASDAIVEVRSRSSVGEFRQRAHWGYWSVALLIRHNVPLSQLPGLSVLLSHKRKGGYCGNYFVAALGQWLGQAWGRLWRPSISPIVGQVQQEETVSSRLSETSL